MIHVLTTGGTIGGLEYQNAEDKPNQKPLAVEDFFKTANVSFNYKIESVLNKDSRFITDKDREFLSGKIKSSTADKILVTHGTFTMVETGKFLANHQIDKTIVLTGSFILGTEAYTDAPFNLGFAISAVESLGDGVYIAMNGIVFNWDNVRKNHQANRFEAISEQP